VWRSGKPRGQFALAIAMVGSAASILVNSASSASVASPPFEPDTENQYGTVALYDATGAPVTGGSITAPIAAYAVASTDDPNAGHFPKATLYGYLPVSGVAPGAWSGKALTSSTTFPATDASAPANPIATTTPSNIASFGADRPVVTGATTNVTLDALSKAFPNTATDSYQGLYQLRVKIAGESKWWAADVKITGTTWALVYPDPGNVVTPPPGPAATTTTLAATPDSPQLLATDGGAPSPVTITATVTSGVAGSVQFSRNGSAVGSPVVVSGGTAALTDTPAGPTAGAGPVTTAYGATFTPTDTGAHSPSSATALSYVVQNPAPPGIPPTTTTVAASPVSPQILTAPGGAAASTTLTATVTAGVAGTVQFTRNGNPLGAAAAVVNGTATATDVPDAPASGAGPATTTYGASFTPTDTSAHLGSTATPVAYVVQNPAAAVTTTALAASSDGILGDDILLTATVQNSTAPATTPVGTVLFYDNGASSPLISQGAPVNPDGRAFLGVVGGLPAGNHSIVATFVPTNAALFATSSSTAAQFNIAEPTAATSTTLTVTPTTASAGSPVTLTATVTASATTPQAMTPHAAAVAGDVTFLDGATTLGTTQLVNGVATWTIQSISAANHAFSAQFNGGTGFADSATASVLTFTVAADPGNLSDGTGGTAAGGSSLPSTGTSADFLAALGLLLLVSGGLALAIKQRRQDLAA